MGNKVLRNRRGYTILELITVLSICFLLIGLIIAGITHAKATMNTQSCATSIRQLSVALSLYTSDYDGIYPTPAQGTFTPIKDKIERARGGDTWSGVLNSYVKSSSSATFPHCPLVDLERIPEYMDAKRMCGYAFNSNLTEKRILSIKERKNTIIGLADSDVRYDSLTVLLSDARLGIVGIREPDINIKHRVLGISVVQLTAFIQEQPSGATRHHGGANYSFVDGHIKWFKEEQLSVETKCDGKTPGFGF